MTTSRLVGCYLIVHITYPEPHSSILFRSRLTACQETGSQEADIISTSRITPVPLDLERFRWQGVSPSLDEGKHTIVFDFKYNGPGPGKGGTGVLSVDGKEVARKTIEHTIPLLMSIDETFASGSIPAPGGLQL